MKSLHSLTAFALLVALGWPARAASPSPQEQVQPLVDASERAANTHDTDAYMAYLRKSPDLVFAFNGQIVRGWDKLHAQQLVWWKNGKSDVVYTATAAPEFDTLAPDTVLVTQQLSSRRTGADGKPSLGTFVVTSVWKHLPEGWRIVYAHESWARPAG
jgi:ketosteroid isomerase-like protein